MKATWLKYVMAVVFTGALAGCDVDVKEEGRMPEMDVETTPGEMPDMDVEGPDVDVRTERREVDVPDVDVDVNREKAEIDVPNVDVNAPDDDNQ